MNRALPVGHTPHVQAATGVASSYLLCGPGADLGHSFGGQANPTQIREPLGVYFTASAVPSEEIWFNQAVCREDTSFIVAAVRVTCHMIC